MRVFGHQRSQGLGFGFEGLGLGFLGLRLCGSGLGVGFGFWVSSFFLGFGQSFTHFGQFGLCRIKVFRVVNFG